MKIRCRDFLTSYRTGAPGLSPEEMDAHLSACPACRQAVAVIEQTRALLSPVDDAGVVLEDRVHQAVMAKIREGAPRPFAFPLRYVAVAAACAVVLMFASAWATYFILKTSATSEELAEDGRGHTPAPETRPVEIEIVSPQADGPGRTSRYRVVVREAGVIEEREFELDEPVLDTIEPAVLPASWNGL